MRISPTQSALLNARERQLLETSGPYEVKQLVTLIKRTRELRDKQRDLAQRHRIAATSRSQSKASAVVARTLKKEQLFSRALEHYEAQLEKIGRECSSAMSELRLGTAKGAPVARVKRATKAAKAPAKTAKTATKVAGSDREVAKTSRTRTVDKATNKARRSTAGKAAVQAMLR